MKCLIVLCAFVSKSVNGFVSFFPFSFLWRILTVPKNLEESPTCPEWMMKKKIAIAFICFMHLNEENKGFGFLQEFRWHIYNNKGRLRGEQPV